jgi:uncharacterized protein YecT (DUF1311 family)
MSGIVWLLACVLLISPAFAEDRPELRPEDRDALEACLQSSLDDGARQEICIVAVQGPCTDEGGGSTYEMLECIGREHAFWDKLLNQSYKRLQSYAEGGDTELKDLQRRWIGWREARCAYEAKSAEGGTLANVIASQCFMEETARRAIDLAAETGEDDRFKLQD